MARILNTSYPAITPVTTVLPVNKGGTGGADPIAAAAALSAIPTTTLGMPDGVGKLDASQKVRSQELPACVTNFPTIYAPTLFAGLSAQIEITNYNTTSSYAVSFTAGEFTFDDGIITYIPPNVEQNVILTVNSRSVTLKINAPKAKTPVVTSPVAGATGVGTCPTFTSSSFQVTAGAPQFLGSDWQIAYDEAFEQVVQSAYGIREDESPFVWKPDRDLKLNTTYYVRTRHSDKIYGSSDWSDAVVFMTKASNLLENERAMLMPGTSVVSSKFGSALSVSGDGSYCAVGNPGDTSGGLTGAGSVSLFKKNASTGYWSRILTLSEATPVVDASFGCDVALSDDAMELFVGASATTSTYTLAGVVYHYRRNSRNTDDWYLNATFTSPSNCASARFGRYVALSKNAERLVVGSARQGAEATDIGHAYYYRKDTSSGDWGYIGELTYGTTPAVASLYGGFIRFVNDDVVGVSAPGETVNAVANAGAIYFFDLSDFTPRYALKLTAPVPTAEKFGTCFAGADGNGVLVGAPTYSSNTGRAYWFTVPYTTGWNWKYATQLSPQNPTTEMFYGKSIAVNKECSAAYIGGHCLSGAPTTSGFVSYHTRYNDDWTQVKTITPLRGEIGMGFGLTLALSTDMTTLVVGAPRTDYGLSDTGSVHVFN